MLSGYNINIISKTKLQEKVNKAVENLLQIPSVSDAMAQVLVQNSIMAIGDFMATPASEIASMTGVDEAAAQAAIDEAAKLVEEGTIELQPEGEEELVSASAVPRYLGIINKESGEESEEGSDKFNEAERRLREELAAFKIK